MKAKTTKDCPQNIVKIKRSNLSTVIILEGHKSLVCRPKRNVYFCSKKTNAMAYIDSVKIPTTFSSSQQKSLLCPLYSFGKGKENK